MGNPMAHYEQTAEEIIAQAGGKLDAVVVGAGTGGSRLIIYENLKHNK